MWTGLNMRRRIWIMLYMWMMLELLVGANSSEKSQKDDYGIIIDVNEYPNENYYYDNYDAGDETTDGNNNTIKIDSSISVEEDGLDNQGLNDYNSINPAVNSDDNLAVPDNDANKLILIDTPQGTGTGSDSALYQLFKKNHTTTTSTTQPVGHRAGHKHHHPTSKNRTDADKPNHDNLNKLSNNSNNTVLIVTVIVLVASAALLLLVVLIVGYKCRSRGATKSSNKCDLTKKNNHKYISVDQT